jgi:hypothetical protein
MVITHTSVAAPHIRTSNEQINNLVVPGTAVNKGTALLTVNHMTSLKPLQMLQNQIFDILSHWNILSGEV